jgi:uncharacterized protein (TIGR02246 family)
MTNRSIAEQAVRAQLEAYNRHDAPAFAATYAEDARIYVFPDQEWIAGREKIRETYGRMFTSTPAVHAEVTQRIVQGERVIDHEHLSGLPNGATATAVAIYEVKNGLIKRVWLMQ